MQHRALTRSLTWAAHRQLLACGLHGAPGSGRGAVLWDCQ